MHSLKTAGFIFCFMTLFVGKSYGIKSWDELPFPIMAWFGPFSDKVNDTTTTLNDMVDAGFTANLSKYKKPAETFGSYIEMTREDNLKMLSMGAKSGIKQLISDKRISAALFDNSIPIDSAYYKSMDSAITDYKDSAALLGYWVYDEPHADKFNRLSMIMIHLKEKIQIIFRTTIFSHPMFTQEPTPTRNMFLPTCQLFNPKSSVMTTMAFKQADYDRTTS